MYVDNVPVRRVRACVHSPRRVHARVTRRQTYEMELSKISNPTNLVGELPRQGDVALRAFRRGFLCGPDGNLFLPHVRRICIRDRNAYAPTVRAKNVRGMRREVGSCESVRYVLYWNNYLISLGDSTCFS